jgi:hypothetical protein
MPQMPNPFFGILGRVGLHCFSIKTKSSIYQVTINVPEFTRLCQKGQVAFVAFVAFWP